MKLHSGTFTVYNYILSFPQYHLGSKQKWEGCVPPFWASLLISGCWIHNRLPIWLEAFVPNCILKTIHCRPLLLSQSCPHLAPSGISSQPCLVLCPAASHLEDAKLEGREAFLWGLSCASHRSLGYRMHYIPARHQIHISNQPYVL